MLEESQSTAAHRCNTLAHRAAGSQIRRPAEKQDMLSKDLTLYSSIRELVISFDGNCSVSIWRLVFDPFPSSRVFTTIFLVPNIVSAHQLRTRAPEPVLALALLSHAAGGEESPQPSQPWHCESRTAASSHMLRPGDVPFLKANNCIGLWLLDLKPSSAPCRPELQLRIWKRLSS